ncbi:MAG: 2-C-methyl-D-erythritol 4-phosphate cytidylyltransferase [Candidatus Rokubacteria bacterium]|nr:2-C-methyl-D-erythritol 4-phosphate cytidylyltransferase [Candidatus Rokubacteria bacterium]
MRDVAVVLPAGGVGRRLGARTPKQFLTIDRVPIIALTARHFARHPAVAEIVVAAPAALVTRTRALLARHVPRARLTVVAGGAERQESVAEGLRAVSAGARVVVVHDAVRPFVTKTLIDTVVDAARESGAAICALPIAETIKRVREGVVEETVDRAGLWAVQTPQAFRADLLREAHDKARRDGFLGTDEAMLVERLGHPVHVVRGHEGNVKITTPEDLRRARRSNR